MGEHGRAWEGGGKCTASESEYHFVRPLDPKSSSVCKRSPMAQRELVTIEQLLLGQHLISPVACHQFHFVPYMSFASRQTSQSYSHPRTTRKSGYWLEPSSSRGLLCDVQTLRPSYEILSHPSELVPVYRIRHSTFNSHLQMILCPRTALISVGEDGPLHLLTSSHTKVCTVLLTVSIYT